jgi:hypothetical protein
MIDGLRGIVRSEALLIVITKSRTKMTITTTTTIIIITRINRGMDVPDG